MYTLQSGQLENALRLGGAPDMTAKEMVQGLANCQQVLEHRSNVELTKPIVNYFPTIMPAGNTFSFPTVLKNITIKVPPFQLKEWDPLPYIPLPPWQNNPYPAWPDYGWDDLFHGDGARPEPGGPPGGPSLKVAGGVSLGPTVIRDLNCGPTTLSELHVTGNTTLNRNLTVNENVRVHGDVYIDGDLTVKNNVSMEGPVTFNGPVNVNGTPLRPATAYVVTDVFWDDTAKELKKTMKTLRFFGAPLTSGTMSVIAGTECP